MVERMSYLALRWRAVRAQLLDSWARRRAAAIVWLAVLGPAAVALVGASVLPLVWAVTQPWPLKLLAVAGHSLVGTGWLVASRGLRWPEAQGGLERSLPIPAALRRRAEATLLAGVLAPLAGTYVLAMVVWQAQQTREVGGRWAQAWALLMTSLMLSVALEIGCRRAGAALSRLATPRTDPRRPTVTVRPVSRWRVLLLMPIMEGPARGLGLRLAASALAGLGWSVAPTLLPDAVVHDHAACAVWLAAYGLGMLAAVSWVRAEDRRSLAPLHAALRSLSVSQRHLAASRGAIAFAPLCSSLAVQQWVQWHTFGPVRGGVAAMYLIVLVAGAVVMLKPAGEPLEGAARNSLLVVLLCALATEVCP